MSVSKHAISFLKEIQSTRYTDILQFDKSSSPLLNRLTQHLQCPLDNRYTSEGCQ
jgi:hypothetical protein